MLQAVGNVGHHNMFQNMQLLVSKIHIETREKKVWFIFWIQKVFTVLRLTHESPVYSRGIVAGRPCHHEYMSTTYGGLWVRGYSVLPSHPAFLHVFTRDTSVLPGHPVSLCCFVRDYF